MSEEKTVYKGRFLKMVKRGKWEYVSRVNATDVVGIVAVHEGTLILTEQYRPPVAENVIDIPAGLAGDIAGQEQEQLQEAAARELWEETGYQAKKWSPVIRLPSSPGLTSETIQLFIASELQQTAAGGGDEHENITVHQVPLSELDLFLTDQQADGKMIDPKVYVAMHLTK